MLKQKFTPNIYYRSPNSSDQNNMNLFKLLKEIDYIMTPCKIIVDNFNLPHMNCYNFLTNRGIEDLHTQMID